MAQAWRRWQAAWRNWRRRGAAERELDEEIRAYAQMLRDEHVAAGMNAHEAARAAAIAMGGAEQVKEAARAARTGAWLGGLARDVRYAARRLRQRPGYALAVVAVLGVGIGLTTALFTAVETLVLRPLPFPQPDELVQVEHLSNYDLVGDAAVEFQPGLKALFTDFALYRINTVDISEGGPAARMRIAMASPDFFRMFGGRLMLGQGFGPRDFFQQPVIPNSKTPPPVPVVLSEQLWRTRYGGRGDVLGKAVHWSGKRYTVVGVTEPGFAFPVNVQAWIPFRNQGFVSAAINPDNTVEDNIVLRMRPGWTPAAAEAQFDRWLRKRDAGADPGPYLIPLQWELAGGQRELALLLWAASGLVLALACASAVGLGVAQAWGRRRELALRLAIGASGARVRRQLLTEGLMLGLAGGTCGLAVAAAAARAMGRWWAVDMPGGGLHLSGRAVLSACGLALACGCAVGLAGSRRQWRWDSEGYGRGAGPVRMRGGPWLTAGQLGLALILVTGTAALAHSLMELTRVPTGMAPEQVLTFEVALPYDSVEAATADFFAQHVAAARKATPWARALAANGAAAATAIKNFQREARSRLLAMPGVTQAGLMGFPPFGGARFQTAFMPRWAMHDKTTARYIPGDLFFAGPGALPALGVTFLSGRDFRSDDPAGCEEILSRSLVKALGFGLAPSAIPEGGTPRCRVVGIVGDVRVAGLRLAPPPTEYQRGPDSDASPFFVVRTAPGMAPESLLPRIRGIMAELAPEAPISHVATLDSLITSSHADLNRATALFGLFALLAAGIAGLSVFAMAAQEAIARTREVGVRMALGAEPRNIRRLILTRQLWPALGALAAAWPLAWGLGRALGRWLYRAKPSDIFSFGGAAAVLLLLVIAAAWMPARRAMRISPVEALRHD